MAVNEPTYRYIGQLVETKTPIVPMLSYVKIKKNGSALKELNIIYYNHKQHSLSRIYNKDFAVFMFDHLISFERGLASQTLVGIVRPSMPSSLEQWEGDTIEKINHESFSLYRGLLSIIGKNDGLPLIIPKNTEIIGDIIPGVKKILQGKNPHKIRQMIKQFESLQNKIATIIGDNPFGSTKISSKKTEAGFDLRYEDLNDKQIARLKRMNNL